MEKRGVIFAQICPANFFQRWLPIFCSSLSRANADTGHIRLIFEGKDCHPASFYDARIGDGLIFHSRLNDGVLNRCLAQGETAVIDHVNDYSPVAQLLQEAVEARVGGVCWIQCYMTRSTHSAFDMHAGDHPVVICQIAGRKHWRHSGNMEGHPESITYEPGDIAFYPRGYEHDVSGVGDLTMHLTIAFDHDENEMNILRRGNGLPYSLSIPVSSDTAARLALRHPNWVEVDGKLSVDLGEKRLKLSPALGSVLDYLIHYPNSKPNYVAKN